MDSILEYVNQMKIITKVRRKLDYELAINWCDIHKEVRVYKYIQVKLFGVIWVNYKRYSFNYYL